MIKDYPNDDLIDDTLFELALVYSEEKQEKSISTYDQLIESHKISPYIGKAINLIKVLFYIIKKNMN